MLIRIILEVFIEAAAVTYISTAIASGSFFLHSIFCVACCAIALIGGLKRDEDKMLPESGQRRYFMTFGHATIWAFFAGIFVMKLV